MPKISYPYPVLGNENSIEGDFFVKLSLKRIVGGELEIKPEEIIISNADIKNLVKNGDAKVILRLYSPSCFYSDCFEITEDKSIMIDENNLINKCEAEALIVLTNELNYKLDSFTEDYKRYSFSLGKNDIIGISEGLSWEVPRQYEKKTSDSIFKWAMHPKESDSKEKVQFLFDQDEIHILYPYNKDVDPVKLMFRSKTYSAYWALVIPALTEAFRIILSIKEKDEFESFRWFHYLEQVIGLRGLESQDPFDLAQTAFVKKSFTHMFNELS